MVLQFNLQFVDERAEQKEQKVFITSSSRSQKLILIKKNVEISLVKTFASATQWSHSKALWAFKDGKQKYMCVLFTLYFEKT